MITVGMLKQILEHFPDNMTVKINNVETITSYSYMSKEYENKTSNILILNSQDINIPIIAHINDNINRGRFVNIDSLIDDIEHKKCGLNIDENIRKMLICKLQDNHEELKNAINDYKNNTDSCNFYKIINKCLE